MDENSFDFFEDRDDLDGNSQIYKRRKRIRDARETPFCPLCPYRKGDNAGRSRKPRTDRYKDRRKGK